MGTSTPPVLRIDLAADVPAYRQIVDGLRRLLVEGRFQPGDQLPTVRQLAQDLGVHHNTVAEAYRNLADEGWLELRRRTGATVLARNTPKTGRTAETVFAQRLRELTAKARAEGVTLATLNRVLTTIAKELKEVSP